LSHIFDAIEASNLRRFGILRAELGSCPFFLGEIARRQKKNFGVGTGRSIGLGFASADAQSAKPRPVRSAPKDNKNYRPGESRKDRWVRRSPWLSEQNDHACNFLRQRFAASVIIEVRLALEPETYMARGQCQEADGE
jgi:hypothetical protein